MIRLYGFDACSPCGTAKKLLQKYGIAYEYIDITRNPCPKGIMLFPSIMLETGEIIEGLGPIYNYLKRG